MINTKYLRDRPFLLVSFIHRPKANVNTGVKGWMNDHTNISTFEQVSVVDRINKKQLECALIVDVIEGTVIKNTTHRPNEEAVSHYIGKYADTIKSALQVWAQKQIAKGLVTAPEPETEAVENNAE